MRRVSCLGLVVVAAILAMPTAQAQTQPRVSLAVSSLKVVYGTPTVLSGRVSTGQAGTSVSIMARSFTSSGFVRVATVRVKKEGDWSYVAKPSIATTYQARLGSSKSRTLMVGVQPRIAVDLLDDGGVRIEVTAAKPLAGRTVQIQRQDAAGAWSTVARVRLNSKSMAVAPPSAQSPLQASLRVGLSVNQAGPGYLGGYSPTVVYRTRWVSLSVSTLQAGYGDSVSLSGRVSVRKPGLALTILARPLWQAENAVLKPLATVKTTKGGRWSLQTKPAVTTAYEARFGGVTSRALTVGVRPAVSVQKVAGGAVQTHAAGGRSFRGSIVQLQQKQSSGDWTTIAKRRLNGKSNAVFAGSMIPSGALTLRVAMSVNQAGTGYLGAFSRPLAYQKQWASISAPVTEVVYGGSAKLTGLVGTRKAGVPVTIMAGAEPGSPLVEIATVTTGPGGRWTYRALPTLTTQYQALWNGASSRLLSIGVRPDIDVRIVSGARVSVRVSAGESFRGRTVQVQRIMDGAWKTFGKMRLGRDSTVIFPADSLPGGTTNLRIAMSVNQAGAGYLAAFSQPFVYQR